MDLAEVSSIMPSTQDRWSVPSSMSKTSLQTEEAFKVEGLKHSHTHMKVNNGKSHPLVSWSIRPMAKIDKN